MSEPPVPSTPEFSAAETKRGFIYATAAYLLWGVFPLYFPLLKPASPLEILAQRITWSLFVCLVLLWITKGAGRVRDVLHNRYQRRILFLAGALVSVNWGVYIWAVNSDHVLETSLGYFINPLVTILFGVMLLGERLRRTQWVAIGIAASAIVVITIDYGRLPWIALVLAFSFGSYGLCKKKAQVGAVESLTVETGFLFLPAVITLSVISAQGNLVFGHSSVGNTLLLACAGLVTAVPLLLFAAGTRVLPLSILGMLQYLAPILQFIVGVTIRHEPLNAAVLAGFCLVWVALVILTVDALHNRSRVDDHIDDEVEGVAEIA